MIRRALLVVLVLAGVGRECFAVTPLALWIDPDGTTYLYNTTASPLSFDGYQIASETNRLDPVGWRSIADQVAADPVGMIGKLGAGALSFGEANPGAGNLAELNLGGVATLQGGAKFSIGKPFLDGGAACPDPTADFFYKIAGQPNGGTSGDSIIGSCPEPSTWLLATLAGVGSLVLRWRPCAKQARPNGPVA